MREQKGKLSSDPTVLSAELESCHSLAPTDTPSPAGISTGFICVCPVVQLQDGGQMTCLGSLSLKRRGQYLKFSALSHFNDQILSRDVTLTTWIFCSFITGEETEETEVLTADMDTGELTFFPVSTSILVPYIMYNIYTCYIIYMHVLHI